MCYKLRNESNKEITSEVKGAIGGHKKLKIFGTLKCKSAARFIAKGQYVENRVFFEDKETAVKAGYRPCARCLPEEYKVWKAA